MFILNKVRNEYPEFGVTSIYPFVRYKFTFNLQSFYAGKLQE